ncbi:putative protein S-acyltransferase [Helianthus annuus]|nr:putative protein S-acyltransferase [Helianthus annuus]
MVEVKRQVAVLESYLEQSGVTLPDGCLSCKIVVAITVFFLLSLGFYAFFSPFLGKEIYEHVAIRVYSFLALSVFVLYVRCTAIDPADPGILIEPGRVSPNRSRNGSEVPGNA